MSTDAARPGTSIYNPHLLAKADLIATFAARQPLLDYLVDDLRRGGHQHHLIVGQRGAGKTTLLLRLAYAIEDDEVLATTTLALRFPEEQYNVHRVSDLWLNCVDALIDRLEQRGERAAVRQLEAEVTRIADGEDEPTRVTQALALLTGWAKRAKRTLVLLVDNLDLILDRLREAHWALRDVLSEDNRLVVVGGSSSHVQETFTYGSAFYDFFATHELGALSEPEARAMLLHLADATAAPRVKEALAEPGRFEALHLFSGGMPRTMVLLLRLLATEGTTRAEQDLELLLDQVTPYYKARFEELPDQSQVVVGALALHYHPMTAAECSKQTGIEVTVVSAQLSRLVRQGVVVKLPSADSSKLSFLIGERLFAIWYAMRTSRRLRRRLLGLVDAVKAFYGQAAVDTRARELLTALCDPDRLLAFASHVEDGALRWELETRAVRDLVLAMGDQPLDEVLELDGADRHLAPVAERVRALEEIRKHVEQHGAEDFEQQPRSAVAWILTAFPFSSLNTKRAHAGLPASGEVVDELSWDLRGLFPDFATAAFFQRMARLLAMTSDGAVPSLPDVTTAAEMDAVWRVVDNQDRLKVAAFIVASSGLQTAATSAITRCLELDATAAIGCSIPLAFTVGRGNREHFLPMLQRMLSSQNDRSIAYFAEPEMWKVLAATPHATALAEALAASDWADHLTPLIEALKAAGEGRRGDLVYLAPELRKPVEEILARWFPAEPAAPPTTARGPDRPGYVVPRGGASVAAETRTTSPKPATGRRPRTAR